MSNSPLSIALQGIGFTVSGIVSMGFTDAIPNVPNIIPPNRNPLQWLNMHTPAHHPAIRTRAQREAESIFLLH